jgi:hypothetical protein
MSDNHGIAVGGGGSSVSQINDLSDVDTVTTAPVAGDCLKFDGTNWVTTTPAATTTPIIFSARVEVADQQLVDGLNRLEAEFVEYDTAGAYDATLFEYTIPVNGVYRISHNALVQSPSAIANNANHFVLIRVNGSALGRTFYSTNENTNPVSNWIDRSLDLQAGDVVYIEYDMNNHDRTLSDGINNNWFQIELLMAT